MFSSRYYRHYTLNILRSQLYEILFFLAIYGRFLGL